MYRFGISYYIMSAANRIPLSGLHVKLVKPGETFEQGIRLEEKPADSGYYETDKLDEPDWGFYQIWDDRQNHNGGFSGKTCTVGKLDARGIKDGSIYTNHLENEAITSEKIAKNAIHSEHIDNCVFPLSKLSCEIQDQTRGIGHPSAENPPKDEDDYVVHTLDREYCVPPYIIITPFCDKNISINEIIHDGLQVKVVLVRGEAFVLNKWNYYLLAIDR